MTDPYEREKKPVDTRPRFDLMRPARAIAWWWLRPFGEWGPGTPPHDSPEVGGWLIWSAIHFTIGFVLSACCVPTIVGYPKYATPLICVVLAIVVMVAAHVVRLWLRASMRLDDDDSRDYWKERFRL